jgi:Rieske 2Fe-2S family protein
MSADFNKADWALHRAHIELLEGMIFINLTPESERPFHSFSDAREWIAPHIRPHGLRDAKVVHTDVHIINANWKLVYENNRECYHCPGGHPEYIMSNYDLSFSYVKNGETGEIERTVDPNHPHKADIEKHIQEKTEFWKSQGLYCTPNNAFPGPGWYRASRQPLRKGYLNESTDGQLVCKKRMGTLPSDDMGSMRVHTLPNFWIHASSDHCASARLTPLNVHQTYARIDWLVHKDAVEGRDYDVQKLIAFWQITNAQDWKLCEVNQLGVMSSVYQPGRLSEKKELGLQRWMDWYLNEVSTPSTHSNRLTNI